MISALSLFVALFVATLTLMLGSGLLGTLVSLRLGAEAFPDFYIGLIMSGFYGGLVLGAFLCPMVVRRTGHIRAFAAFAALNTATALAYPLWISGWFWFACRIMTGISMMGMYMVVESWLNDRTEPQMRGRVFSVYMSMTFLGLGFGQLFLTTGDVMSSDLFLIVGIFLVLSLVPVVMTRSLSPSLPEVVNLDIRHLFRRAPMGLLGSLATGMMTASFYSLAPVFAVKSGLDIHLVAYYMGLTILCGFLMQWPVGSLSDRHERQGMMALLALLMSLASLLVILSVGKSAWSLFVATACYGGLAFTLYPVSVAHINDRIEASEIIAASSVTILFYGVGAFLGPIAAAYCMALLGPQGLFAFISLVSLIFGAVVGLYRRFEKPVSEAPIPYIPVPRTSPIISTLHPYSEAGDSEHES